MCGSVRGDWSTSRRLIDGHKKLSRLQSTVTIHLIAATRAILLVKSMAPPFSFSNTLMTQMLVGLCTLPPGCARSPTLSISVSGFNTGWLIDCYALDPNGNFLLPHFMRFPHGGLMALSYGWKGAPRSTRAHTRAHLHMCIQGRLGHRSAALRLPRLL